MCVLDMMCERGVLSGFSAVLLSVFVDYLYPLRWFCLAAFFLTLSDLHFGIAAAHKRGERVRCSRAIRRTMNKIVDYVCWILLASSLDYAIGSAFDVHVISVVVMSVVYGAELNSCFTNYFESRGRHVRWNFFKWLKRSHSIDLGVEDDEGDGLNDEHVGDQGLSSDVKKKGVCDE